MRKINTETDNIDCMYNSIHTNIPIYFKKIEAITNEYNVSKEILTKELLKYLIITAKSPQTTSPSYIVDLAWHELILFTRYYEKFCTKNFDRFIHHTPSENENPEIYEYTLKQYQLLFNTAPKEIWYRNNSFNLNDINCGACHN
ncbi:glycine-rich domain-containing protein [Wenyingzhuangia sp. IMCC45574]